MALSSWKILFWISISAKLSPHFNFCLRQIYIPTGVHAQKRSHPILSNVLLLYFGWFVYHVFIKKMILIHTTVARLWDVFLVGIFWGKILESPFFRWFFGNDKSQPNNLQLLPSRYDFSFVIVNHLSLQCYFLLNG